MTNAVASGRRRGLHRTSLRHAIALGLLMTVAGVTQAQTSRPARDFDIPAGTLVDALNRFGEQSGLQVSYDLALLKGKRAPAVKGHLSADAALEQLLRGAGLGSRYFNDRTIIINKADKPPSPTQSPVTSAAPDKTGASAQIPTDIEAVTVTGTRIRGGTTPSPIVTIGTEQIAEEGFTDLGEVIRSLPQNFGGGQNPGVAAGSILGGDSNNNATGGSALNLRGLGADATLTLLNGRRLAYDGRFQAVDISSIPVEAVERVEIVPDGASAIYGSDAVGGVANVLLKRDYEGVTVGTRYGQAADGGLTTREYTITAGTSWQSGGLIATYKKSSSDPIFSEERSYTEEMSAPTTIYPGVDSYGGLISAYQSVGEMVELRLDALKNHRKQESFAGYPTYFYGYAPETSIWLISPSITLTFPNDWSLTAGGTYSKDETDYRSYRTTPASSTLSANCFCNESRSYEFGAEGPVFSIGNNEARLAIGIGSRRDDYQYRSYTSATRYGGDEGAHYAYSELNLPLISPASNVSGIKRLEVSAAIRSEDYDSFGQVTTPKLGLVYAPNGSITFKTSWGKSFKAPTLYQRYLDKSSYLYAANTVGGNGYATDETVLVSYGGSDELKAERAKSWTTSLAFHPEMIPEMEAELTWFDIDYTDRVILPVPNFSQALSNPNYAEFVSYSITAEEQAALLSTYSTFYNYATSTYDPNKVVAIIRDQYVNAARQRIHGMDLSGAYRLGLSDGRLTFRGSISWLDSTQQNSSGQSSYDLAGTIFNPAKINGRFGTVWTRGSFSAASFVNYTSGVTSELTTTKEKTASFTTIDLSFRYETGKWNNVLSGFIFVLSAQNVFNRPPPLYTTTSSLYVPYDSTNYSAIGRFVSLSISKRF